MTCSRAIDPSISYMTHSIHPVNPVNPADLT